ncbi:alpha/beta hydrolase [Streptomyces sp. NPDC096310]|uniref:alpha/beta hydrolase n=1 Tax=Streptomyces sp. NPDC096310 TaxID=3366082 RepID=UPI00380F854A
MPRTQALRRALAALVTAGALGAAAVTGPAAPPAGGAVRTERDSGARVIEERAAGERLVDLTVRSPALAGDGAVRLLTPDGWEERRPGDRWPVLYLLAGGDGDHLTWTEEYGIQDLPELRHTLVVMPAMPLFGFYSDWWRRAEDGPRAVETFHLREVRPLLERRYGAGTRRAVAGESQGGFGALAYTARNPGMFRGAASYSGFVHPSAHPRAVRAAMTYLGLDWRRLWGDPVAQRGVWEAHDPYHLAPWLGRTPVFVSSGDGRAGALDPDDVRPDPEIPGLEDPARPFPEDVISPTEALMGEESRAVAERLRRQGTPLTTHFYRGTHDPVYWERELRRSLPMLLRSLGPQPG